MSKFENYKFRKQLVAYYEQQGLDGEELFEAVEEDVKRVVAEMKADGNGEDYPTEDDNLSCLFYWDRSPQGCQYWDDRDEAFL